MIRPNFRALFLLKLFIALSSGCNLTANYVLEERLQQSVDYIVVGAPARLQLPCVQDFLKFKQGQGFQIQTLKLDLSKDMSARCLSVQTELAKHSSTLDASSGYVLILATPDELTMGPWKFEGLDRPRLSDVPYFLGKSCPPEKEVAKDAWECLLDDDYVWDTGRIPYDDPSLLATIFDSTKRYFKNGREKRRAMLGAERFAVPFDSSLILNSAKKELTERGWEVVLHGRDWPYDVELGREGVGRPYWLRDEEFMRSWAKTSPQLVYTLSHGGSRSIGRFLIDPIVLSRLSHKSEKGKAIEGTPYIARETRTRIFEPKAPAVLFSTGCFSGSPRSTVIRGLFEKGWLAGFGGFLDYSIPLPLVAALNSEVNVAKFAASKLPMSRVIRLIREVYVDQSSYDPFYWMVPYVRRSLMTNCLASIYYGDPSLSYDLRPGTGGPKTDSCDIARR
ncbi:MAG: hypothetical protein P1V97_27515 [Planctomycetota bacterium]|nr:hypothetical protein [Planctomycetota bacterium]